MASPHPFPHRLRDEAASGSDDQIPGMTERRCMNILRKKHEIQKYLNKWKTMNEYVYIQYIYICLLSEI